MRLLLSTVLFAILLFGQTERFDSIAAGYAKERGFMGTVLVARDGKVVFEKGYGMANLELDVPNTATTKFRLGSITKQFTAVAVLQLVEEGKLALDDTLPKFWPECPEAWRAVTIHQLLNHTSGIASYTDQPGFMEPKGGMRKPMTPVEIAALTKDVKMTFQPGEGYRYNNTGYVLLGHVIEKVTDQKYDAVLKKRIFDPLGMKDTGYDWTEHLIRNRAAGYRYNALMRAYNNSTYIDMSLPHAAGSLYSTVRDLVLWDQALNTDKLLKKETRERMFTPGKSNYGYGWVIQKGARTVIAHGGGIPGFSTMINRYPDQNALIVVLSNVENVSAGLVAKSLEQAMFGETVRLAWERKEINVDPAVFERHKGVYQLPNMKITMTVEDGKLMTQAQGQPKFQLFPMSETRYFLKVVDAEVEFGDGEMTLYQGGAVIKGKRTE